METYLLKRIRTGSAGTFGELWHGADQLCVTAELPWKDNQHLVSCIPEGRYNVGPHNSAEHPHVWELLSVPDRTGILIHEGNLPLKDSLGCIIIGDRFGAIDDQPAVLDSRITLNALRKELPQEFELVISKDYA